MKIKILLLTTLFSTLLNAMGHDVNYDEKFDQEEKKELNIKVVKAVEKKVPSVTQPVEQVQEVAQDNPLEGVLIETLYYQKRAKNPGEKEQYVQVEDVDPNSKLTYINKVKNSTSEVKKGIVIRNPLPVGTEYVLGSASCLNRCTIRYSADGGRTLTESDKGGEAYNYIEFTFATLPPQQEYKMGFDVFVR